QPVGDRHRHAKAADPPRTTHDRPAENGHHPGTLRGRSTDREDKAGRKIRRHDDPNGRPSLKHPLSQQGGNMNTRKIINGALLLAAAAVPSGAFAAASAGEWKPNKPLR